MKPQRFGHYYGDHNTFKIKLRDWNLVSEIKAEYCLKPHQRLFEVLKNLFDIYLALSLSVGTFDGYEKSQLERKGGCLVRLMAPTQIDDDTEYQYK